MSSNNKNERADKLAAQVAEVTGESKTEAVIKALEERLERLRGRRSAPSTLEALMEISRRCAALPDVDTRPVGEILGYDGHGLSG